MLVMITWEDKCGLTQLWGNALNMNAMGLASQFYRQMQNLCIMVVQLFMCFYNAPEKLQKHKIHRDIDFHLLCLFLMCSQIRSIFRTGDSSVFLLLLLASSSGVWWTDRIPTTSRRILPVSWLKMTQESIGHITNSISCGFSCSHVGQSCRRLPNFGRPPVSWLLATGRLNGLCLLTLMWLHHNEAI